MKFFMRPFKLALRGMAIFLLFIAIWLGPVALAAAPPSVAKQSLQEVSEGLTCQCGCGLTVANCNHPTCNFAVPLRVEIEGLLSKGMGRVVILASFRHKYGEKILSAPTTEVDNAVRRRCRRWAVDRAGNRQMEARVPIHANRAASQPRIRTDR